MPPDAFDENGGGVIDWDDQNLLLSPNGEHWLRTASASASASASAAARSLRFDSSAFQVQAGGQPQISNANAGDLSDLTTNLNPVDNAFFSHPSQLFAFDTHQGQHWSDLPSQEHGNLSTEAALIGSGGEKPPLLGVDELSLDSIGPVGESSSQSGGEKGERQDFNISRALLSPSRNSTASKSQVTEPIKPQRPNRQSREEPLPNQPFTKTPMSTPSGYNSSNPGPGAFDRRKNTHPYPGHKGTSMNRVFSRSAPEIQDEDESRRNQLGLYTRGGSVVSTASGHSRSDNALFRSDTMDDENISGASIRSENKGAGRTPGVLRTRQGEDLQNGQQSLPHAKGFSIQIGSEIFKLSGASIMSDGQYSHVLRVLLGLY